VALWLGIVAKCAQKVFYPFINIELRLSVHLYYCVQSAIFLAYDSGSLLNVAIGVLSST
jgi:hypothetical protein